MAYVIAVSNQKGGVAKTTTCMSLGACLAEQGKQVLLVDLDPQSNLTMAAGLDPDELENTLSDLLVGEGDFAQAIHELTLPGFHILPADIRLAGLDAELRSLHHEGYESQLLQVLSHWTKQFDYILLDCPPSLGSMTLMALTAADLVLIPVQCEFYAARGLMRLMDIITAIKMRTNPPLTYHLLVTLYDKRNRISREVLAQLQENFEGHLFETRIEMDTRLRESPLVGEPVILFAPRSRSSGQYRQVALELLAMG